MAKWTGLIPPTAEDFASSVAVGAAVIEAVLASEEVNETFEPRTKVVVAAVGGDYTSLAEVFVDHPTGNVEIFVKDIVEHPETLIVNNVKNVVLQGGGRGTSQLLCAQGLVSASNNSDQWQIRNLTITCTTATNTFNCIEVDYPRRWWTYRNTISGFGGKSIRYRGGIHASIEENHILAKDATNTNGYAGIALEVSSTGVYATVFTSRRNYVGTGKQYGFLFQNANVGSVFESDVAELCDVGMRFEVCGGVVISPYTEGNRVAGIQTSDSILPFIGWLRDEPVATWTAVATAERYPVRIGRNWVNPGKAIIYAGNAAAAMDPNLAPSIRWGTGSPEGAVIGVVGSKWYRLDGVPNATEYIKESGTGNTGWTAVSQPPSPSLLEAVRHNNTAYVKSMSATEASASVTTALGNVYLTHFTPLQPATITKLEFCTVGAWSNQTLIRYGLYLVNADGTVTLVAATSATNPQATLIGNTPFKFALSTDGGLPASYTLIAGQRYATAFLAVGGTAGTLRGAAILNGIANRGLIESSVINTQTDLPTGPVAVATSGVRPWSGLSAT
jgi:hypothetical protein